MIISRFKKAYKKNGRTNFPHTMNKTGVYLIANKKGKIVYVGFSGVDLYKTMYRHFQSWEDPTQVRATFPKWYKIRVVFTTPKKAQRLEKALILKHKPSGNPDKLQGYELDNLEVKEKDEYFDTYLSNDDDLPF